MGDEEVGMALRGEAAQTVKVERGEAPSGQRTLADYIAVIRRRKWVALVPVLLVPLAAFAYGFQQPKLYGASSEVLLSRENIGSVLSGRPSANAYTEADRFAQTQASLARVPEVARRAVVRAKSSLSPGALLAASTVIPRGNADLLSFNVTTGDPESAGALATAYAQAFAQYRLELDTASLTSARRDLEKSIDKLRGQGVTETALFRNLVEKEQELRTLELLQTKPQVVKAADKGNLVAPTPKRNAMLGLAVGLLLGLGAAFLWEALDKRVRDEAEIERTLGIPLLARLPAPRQENGRDQLAMLAGPTDAEAEAVRRLRSNIEFANLDVDAKVIMVTSSVSGEGKSMTAANLALALARSGRRVALVDLDLRRPNIGPLFRIGYRPGLTDVAIERIDLETALIPVPLEAPEPIRLASRTASRARRSGDAEGSRSVDPGGQLWILPAGFLPASPGELVGTQAVANILSRLKERADFVLVDAPPLLAVSDAMTLTRRVEAVLVVTRLGIVNRSMLRELARQLDASTARKLGFVLTGADATELYGLAEYGYRIQTPAPAEASHATAASRAYEAIEDDFAAEPASKRRP
jgi:tyrosine-protein kinase